MKYLKLSADNKVATITINRPPANALSVELVKELDNVLDQVEKNDEVRVILLHGEGRFFSAGADIKDFTTIEKTEDFISFSRNGQRVMERMEKFPKPIIAAIHGAALGGGMELALACHIRLVAENAKLGLPELTLGIIPGFAGTQRLPKYVGVAKAAEMILTSEPVSGKEAVEIGLANKAYPPEELLENAYIMAEKIANKSPATLKAIINLLTYAVTKQFNDGVKKEAELFGEVFTTEDAKEGVTAFLEKRKPSFKGK